MSYLEDNSSNDGFIWINYYYTDEYEEILFKNWIGNSNSMEIQNEFSENATCVESSKYKSYRLI